MLAIIQNEFPQSFSESDATDHIFIDTDTIDNRQLQKLHEIM